MSPPRGALSTPAGTAGRDVGAEAGRSHAPRGSVLADLCDPGADSDAPKPSPGSASPPSHRPREPPERGEERPWKSARVLAKAVPASARGARREALPAAPPALRPQRSGPYPVEPPTVLSASSGSDSGLSQDARPSDEGGVASADPGSPSRPSVVVLSGLGDLRVVDLDEWPEFFEDMLEDVRRECDAHGEVLQAWADRDDPSCGVWLRFAAPSQAEACRRAMNHRWFAGRRISAVARRDVEWRGPSHG